MRTNENGKWERVTGRDEVKLFHRHGAYHFAPALMLAAALSLAKGRPPLSSALILVFLPNWSNHVRTIFPEIA